MTAIEVKTTCFTLLSRTTRIYQHSGTHLYINICRLFTLFTEKLFHKNNIDSPSIRKTLFVSIDIDFLGNMTLIHKKIVARAFSIFYTSFEFEKNTLYFKGFNRFAQAFF